MPAFVIAEIEVKDPRAYDEYKKGVGATVEKFGGRFLVRGGKVTTYEGGWKPERMIVIEFPDTKALDAWYNSPDYKPLLELRLSAAGGRLIGVEGA